MYDAELYCICAYSFVSGVLFSFLFFFVCIWKFLLRMIDKFLLSEFKGIGVSYMFKNTEYINRLLHHKGYQ